VNTGTQHDRSVRQAAGGGATPADQTPGVNTLELSSQSGGVGAGS
jgi:hypothetical protein